MPYEPVWLTLSIGLHPVKVSRSSAGCSGSSNSTRSTKISPKLSKRSWPMRSASLGRCSRSSASGGAAPQPRTIPGSDLERDEILERCSKLVPPAVARFDKAVDEPKTVELRNELERLKDVRAFLYDLSK